MKRNVNLQSLSKDHHDGLLLGWKIARGLKHNVSVGTICDYVQYFASEALLPHFEEEESVILRFFKDENKLVRRMVFEHKELKEQIESVRTSGQVADLVAFAQSLEQHIRFEERELFPYIEQALSKSDLEEIGKQIDAIHRPFAGRFPDEFWKNKS